MNREERIPIYFTKKHYAFAFIVFLCWSYLILRNDHLLGCPAAHGVLYHTWLHIATLLVYMTSHAVVIHQVERINKPYEFAISKMGNVLIMLRQLKFYLMVRILIICLWLYIVFHENAEETYIPVGFLFGHLCLVIATFHRITSAVKIDNSRLPASRERLVLSRAFYIASTVEVIFSTVWFLFNIADVHLCHEWYEWSIRW